MIREGSQNVLGFKHIGGKMNLVNGFLHFKTWNPQFFKKQFWGVIQQAKNHCGQPLQLHIFTYIYVVPL